MKICFPSCRRIPVGRVLADDIAALQLASVPIVPIAAKRLVKNSADDLQKQRPIPSEFQVDSKQQDRYWSFLATVPSRLIGWTWQNGMFFLEFVYFHHNNFEIMTIELLILNKLILIKLKIAVRLIDYQW